MKYDFAGTLSAQIRVELLKSTQFLKSAQMLEIDPCRGDFKKPQPELVIPKTSLSQDIASFEHIKLNIRSRKQLLKRFVGYRNQQGYDLTGNWVGRSGTNYD